MEVNWNGKKKEDARAYLLSARRAVLAHYIVCDTPVERQQKNKKRIVDIEIV